MDIHIFECLKYRNTWIHQCVIRANSRNIINIYSTLSSENAPRYAQVIIQNGAPIIAFSTITIDSEEFQLIRRFIKAIIHNNSKANSTEFVKRTTYSTKCILFQTPTGIFKALLNDQPFHTSLKVGGSTFMSCIELFIPKTTESHPRLSQIYSEPECWESMEKGETIEMIKGTLQLAQTIFNIEHVTFEDKSQIECGITDMSQSPPRKMDKPISLTHLSLITTGKTWYERHFNAQLFSSDNTNQYDAHRKILQTPIHMTFDVFSEKAYLTSEQMKYLKPFFEKSVSWFDFFKSIPKEMRCNMLFNWVPFFVDNILFSKFKLREKKWYIPLGVFSELNNTLNDDIKMSRISMYIISDVSTYRRIEKSQYAGNIFVKPSRKSLRARTRKNTKTHTICKNTRKTKINILSLSNSPIGQTM